MMENIIIRPLTEISEFIEAVEVQKRAWNRDDYSLVPLTMFKSFVKNGGCVIGALLKKSEDISKVIGYAIGFLSITKQGILFHHSQQVAVLPEYQQLGLAFKLKQAQKDFVKKEYNVPVMSWTVDPLLSKNAFLNYHKLGTIGRLYWINYYGSRTDNLNAGLETDRIEVEWWFSEPEVQLIKQARNEIPDAYPIIDYSESGTYSELIPENNSYIGVIIPRDLLVLKEKQLDLAIQIRVGFRNLALKLLDLNYCIIDVKSKVEPKTILIWTKNLQGLKKFK